LSLFIIVALLVICIQGKTKQQAAMELSENELGCLVEAIYFEARDQSLLGQAAVASVIMNRVRSSLYPNSVCAVVWQNRQLAIRMTANRSV
jgi:spore germination cell wall hydrolase CwlJ-like protein